MTTTDPEREAFEAWICSRATTIYHKNFPRGEYGNYTEPCMEGMWNAWQAARSPAPATAGSGEGR